MASQDRWSRLGGAAVALVGAGFVWDTTGHLLTEHRDPVTLVLGGGLPLLLGIGTVIAGVLLWRSGVERRTVTRLLGWWLGGVAVAAAMGVVIVVYQQSHGVALIDARYVVVNNAIAGSAGGLVVGYVDAQRRRRAAEVVEEREELAAERERLEILNRVVRHDIKNDTGVVLGWLSTLEDHVDDDGQPALERVRTASEHILELTEIARDYVEVVVDGTDVDLEPVPLAEVLETEVETRAEIYPHAEFTLEDPPAVSVRANDMLGSVFRNVLNNAVQHNDEETPRVEVSVAGEDDSVVVRVADNGPGIPDDRKERVFGKGKTELDSRGAGIGLYLVQTLVAGYGGDVWIEDNEPTGSVVAIRLPTA